jgi:hypothetical protein
MNGMGLSKDDMENKANVYGVLYSAVGCNGEQTLAVAIRKISKSVISLLFQLIAC